MVLKILLIISIILQLFAAFSAIGLIRHTKFNSTWILFTLALTFMALLRFVEYEQLVGSQGLTMSPDFFIWIGAFTSLCFAMGVILVRKFIKMVQKLDVQSRMSQRRILNTIIHTEEKERARFSKDLHDGLGPLLSSAKMSLSALERTQNPQQREVIIANTQVVISEAISSIREISNNLSPHVLKDFGLQRAIMAFIEKSSFKDRFEIDFTSNIQDIRFDNNVEVVLYRVVCELLNNSFKHSKGDKITLKLNFANLLITLVYFDNGQGYDVENVMDVGMGLSNINSRISSIKGVLEFNNMPKGMYVGIKIDTTKQDLWKKYVE